MKRIFKFIIVGVAGVLLIAILVLAGVMLWEKVTYSAFYSKAEREFKIPGLWGGSVPQGFEYLEDKQTYIYTGYHKDEKSPSMIYIMPEDGEGKSRKIELFNEDGTNYTSHAGGVTVYKNYLYIASAGAVDVFSLDDVLETANEIATKINSIMIDFDVAFVEVKGDKLYAGEFYRPEYYETPESHHMTTPKGDENKAVIYELDLDSETGLLKSAIPTKVYSIAREIQGMTFGDDNKIILSRSWGLTDSNIYVYDEDDAKTGTMIIDGQAVPVTYLDSGCMTDNIVAPPMAEEIVYKDGKIYILTEAACMKYVFGKLTGADHVYAYEYKD